MEITNLLTVECTDEMEHEGFRIRETQIGPRLGAEPIGGSVYEVDPGKKLWPYHLHHANEEWLLVVRGRPTLRTPEGERQLVEGDVACFPRGAAGAHQVRNDTEEPARILMLSTELVPEILEYPDSGKVAALDAKGDGLFQQRHGEHVGYWDGES
ncbi:MAG: cupin domain-containing protein [Thermoleophilia bacterium]|nr:cupin domain-containing protein [Thermoleophilia bacterium]